MFTNYSNMYDSDIVPDTTPVEPIDRTEAEDFYSPSDVTIEPEPEIPTASKTNLDDEEYIGIVNYQEVYVRSEPNFGPNTITTAKRGDEVIVTGAQVDGFWKVCLSSGVEGYIKSEYIDIQ